MATKPTIYKFRVALSDLDRQVYDGLDLTVALHPSETIQRMAARVLAFCINAEERLAFTTGLSTPDEPDITLKQLNGTASLWIDVGEPAYERVRKAVSLAERVRIYSFNSKSETWWAREGERFSSLPIEVFRFAKDGIDDFAALITRTNDCSLMISDMNALFATDDNNCEVSWQHLNY